MNLQLAQIFQLLGAKSDFILESTNRSLVIASILDNERGRQNDRNHNIYIVSRIYFDSNLGTA